MNRVVSFFAEGVAAPEGSHRYVGYRGGRPVVAHDNPRLAGWRTIVARAVGDALAAPGGILLEDSRIVTWVLTKRWASDGQPPGVHVAVTAIND